MSRIKLLLDVIEDMRSLADSLQAVADAMAQGDGTDEPAHIDDTPAPAEQATEQKPTLEEVRAVLGQKSRAGYTDAVRGLLRQFGATKLSEVDSRDYDSLMKAAEELDHGT